MKKFAIYEISIFISLHHSEYSGSKNNYQHIFKRGSKPHGEKGKMPALVLRRENWNSSRFVHEITKK